MAGVNLANFGLLQLDYEDLIVEMLSSGVNMFKHPKMVDWKGSQIDYRVRTKKNPNMGFTEDGGAYGDPGKQTYETVRIGRRFFQMKLMVTKGVVAAAGDNKGALRSAIASETSGAIQDQMDFYNKIGFLDGTGLVATLVTVAGGATALTADQGALLWPGAVLEWHDGVTSTVRGFATVVSVANALTSTGGNVTFAVDAIPVGGAIGDGLYWYNGSSSSYNRAIAGLDLLIDDATGTFQNVSVTNNPQYTSYVNSASANRPITPFILRQTMAAMIAKAGNSAKNKPLKAFTGVWQLLEFESAFEGAYRLVEQSGDKVGFKGKTFDSAIGQVEMEVDTDCPRGKIFIADFSQIKHRVQQRLEFSKEPTGGIWRESHDGLYLTAVMSGISQLSIDDRKTSAKIENLSDSAVFSL